MPASSRASRSCATSTAPRTSRSRWRASPTSPTRSSSPAATRRGTMVKASARRRQGFTHDVEVSGHRLVVDEPEEAGGANEGPSPTRMLAASLAACTAITMEMYADRKGWELDEVEVQTEMEYGESGVP